MSILSAREGYRRWAPHYAQETAISYLESRLVEQATPPAAGRRLLDAGCGVGRRLLDCGAAMAVGVDLSLEMLEAGIGIGAPHARVRTMVGDVRALPLPDSAFDIVWCRLVVGHLPECGRAYAELARVADRGATVIVTDFHAAAHEAGHRRTFRDDEGIHEIEHYVHAADRQIEAARAAGLEPTRQVHAAIGPSVRLYYERAGRSELYHAHEGLPVALLLAFRKD